MNKRQIYFSLLIIQAILVGAIVRYFKILEQQGEYGTDSWMYNSLIGQIISDGNINWIKGGLLGYYGYYPPYQEPGGLIFFSAIELLTGIDNSYSLPYTTFLIGLMSFLLFSLLSTELGFNKYVSINIGLVIFLSNGVITDTSWSIGIRTIFILLLPLNFYFFYRLFNRFSVPAMLLFILSMITIYSIHRMSIALLPILLFYFVVYRILASSIFTASESIFFKYRLISIPNMFFLCFFSFIRSVHRF